MKGEQVNLDFNQAKPLETEDEKNKRLPESIREARRTDRPLTQEESNFIEEERRNLDDNPYQNKTTSH